MPSTRYTRSQVATLLHVAPKTLYNWEREGKIPPPLRDARGWRRYSEADLRELRGLVAGEPVGPEPAARVDGEPSPLGEISLAFSARNCLRGTVKSIVADGVTAEVVIDLGNGQEIVAVITRSSVVRLGLREGEPVVAVFKATEVMVAR